MLFLDSSTYVVPDIIHVFLIELIQKIRCRRVFANTPHRREKGSDFWEARPQGSIILATAISGHDRNQAFICVEVVTFRHRFGARHRRAHRIVWAVAQAGQRAPGGQALDRGWHGSRSGRMSTAPFRWRRIALVGVRFCDAAISADTAIEKIVHGVSAEWRQYRRMRAGHAFRSFEANVSPQKRKYRSRAMAGVGDARPAGAPRPKLPHRPMRGPAGAGLVGAAEGLRRIYVAAAASYHRAAGDGIPP